MNWKEHSSGGIGEACRATNAPGSAVEGERRTQARRRNVSTPTQQISEVMTEELTQRLQSFLGRVTISPPLAVGFSGIDGAGKTTQLRYLDEWLKACGLTTFPTKVVFHGMSAIYRLAEKMTGDPFAYHPIVPATLREFVIACDYAVHYFDVVEAELRAGKTILWDRSGFCYRVYAHAFGADLTWIRQVYELVPPLDIVFLLDAPADVAYSRLLRRREKPARADEHRSFLSKVRETYLVEAHREKHVVIVDASATPDETQVQIRRLLMSKLSEMLKGRKCECQGDL